MKKSVAWLTLVCCALMMVISTGCNGVKLPEVSEAETTRTTLKLLNVDIASLITREELEQNFGETLRDPQVSNEGRTLLAFSEDGTESVSINVEEKRTIDQFREALPKVDAGELEALPNLAEEAWWMPAGHTAFLFCRGYTVSITVSSDDWDDEEMMMTARQIASCLCNRLPV